MTRVPMQREEIETRVRRLVADALGVGEDEITMRSRLISELGASSIDVIEINFQLEQDFGIEIPASDFWNLSAERSNPAYFQGGCITAAGIEMLRGRFPDFDSFAVSAGDPVSRLFDSLTLGTIADYVEGRLQTGAKGCEIEARA
jgi:acyl carrier protein